MLRDDVVPFLDRADERMAALSAALDTQTARATSAETALAARVEELRAALARVDQLSVEAAGLRDTIRRLEADLADCRARAPGAGPVGAYLQGRPNPFGRPLGCERLFDGGSPASWSLSAMAKAQPDTGVVIGSTKHPVNIGATQLGTFLGTVPDGQIVAFQHEPERSSKNIDPVAWIGQQERALLLAEARRQAGHQVEVVPIYTGWLGDETNKNRLAAFATWVQPLIGKVRRIYWDPYWWADLDGNAVETIRLFMDLYGLDGWGIGEIGWDAETAVVKAGILPTSATDAQIQAKLQVLTARELDLIDVMTAARARADLDAALGAGHQGKPAEHVAIFHADGAWGSGARHYRLDPGGAVPRPKTLALVQEYLAA